MSCPEKDEIEKEQVKWVFSLTGGELADEPLRYASPAKYYGPTSMATHRARYERHWARYWYDGSPDWFEERPRGYGNFLTIVACRLYSGELPRKIYAKGKRWRRVEVGTHSGETECPGRENDNEGIVQPGESKGKECPLCEAKTYDRHEFIYLGDGWAEVVYKEIGS